MASSDVFYEVWDEITNVCFGEYSSPEEAFEACRKLAETEYVGVPNALDDLAVYHYAGDGTVFRIFPGYY